jgi:hypothetical protein
LSNGGQVTDQLFSSHGGQETDQPMQRHLYPKDYSNIKALSKRNRTQSTDHRSTPERLISAALYFVVKKTDQDAELISDNASKFDTVTFLAKHPQN